MAARRAAEKRRVGGIMDGIYLELLIVLGRGCLVGAVMSAELPMQMDLIPGNVYSCIKYTGSLKFFRHTWYQTHPSLFESVS